MQAILRRRKVENRTGLGRSSIYQKMKNGEFPRPVSIGARAIGWVEAEIDAWVASQIAKSRTTAGRQSGSPASTTVSKA